MNEPVRVLEKLALTGEQQEQMAVALIDVFERADMMCHYAKKAGQRQGQWRVVMLTAKAALKHAKIPLPETMAQREKARK